MIFEIAALIAVGLFALLTYYIIQTLQAMKQLISKMEMKAKKFDSLLESISNVGDVCEKESEVIKSKVLICPEHKEILSKNLSHDLVEWLLMSLKLFTKFLTRR